MDFLQAPKNRMLNIAEVQELIGVSRTTIWRWISEGHFPAPRALSSQVRRWWSSEVHDWIAGKPIVTEADQQ